MTAATPESTGVSIAQTQPASPKAKASTVDAPVPATNEQTTDAVAASKESTPTPTEDSKESSNSPRTSRSSSNVVLLNDQPITRADTSKISLPPIEHVLERIDAYQNEQKLQDSQLLLNFRERNASFHSDTSEQSIKPESQPQQHAPPMATFNAQMDITFKSEGTPSTPTSGKLTEQQTITPGQGSLNVLNLGPDMTKTASRQSSVGSSDSTGGSTPGSSSAANSLKKRTNLPRETIEILNEWVLNNLDNPYPNHTQKKLLLERTGLSNVQLSNWFINKRRRRIFSNLSGNQGQPIKKKRLIDRL